MRMDTLDWRHKAIATACLALCGAAWSAPFTPGNLVAYRVGTGTGALPVYLDEYRVDGTLVQSLPLSGGATPLTASSTGSEGLLNRSANGLCLTVPGYAVAPGGADPKTAAARGVAFVDADGGVGNGTRLGGTALVGDAATVADRLREYAALGADSFVLSGYPHLEESIRFAELVFPLLGKRAVTTSDQAQTGGAFDIRSIQRSQSAS